MSVPRSWRRLNIRRDRSQDKSNLVYLQELKEEMERGHLKPLTLLVAKRVLVQSGLPESCSSLVSVLPPLTRRVPSVAQSPGDRRLDPASEDFNMTKAMTLGRGRGEAPRVALTAPGWFSQGAHCSHANQRGYAINHHVSRVSPQLARFPARAWTRKGACSASAP